MYITKYLFYLNIDNIYLKSELKNSSSENIKLIEARYKYGIVLIGLCILNQYTKTKEANQIDESEVYNEISKITKAISPVLLPLIETLGELKIDDVAEAFPEI